MQCACEAAPRLIPTRRDVVEQVDPRRLRLLKADGSASQVVFRFPVLPKQARRHADDAQQPQVIGGESVRCVVYGDGADPAFARAPRGCDRARHLAEARVAPYEIEAWRRALDKLSLAGEDDPLDHALAFGAELQA